MVFLSATCFSINAKEINNYYAYYKKRFIRLILPVWIFLTIYFGIGFLVMKDIPIKHILQCYTLTTGWYLWIIRVFVTMAVAAPFLIKYSKGLTKHDFIKLSLFVLVLNEALTFVSGNYWYSIVLMTLPYMLIYMLGINIRKFDKEYCWKLSLSMFIVYALQACLLFMLKGEYVLTGTFKYPPRLYYLSYSLLFIFMLWMYKDNITNFVQKCRLLPLVTFIGSHTMWIYLWHIPLIEYFVPKEDTTFSFFYVYILSVSMTYIQCRIVGAICKHIGKEEAVKMVRTIFIG